MRSPSRFSRPSPSRFRRARKSLRRRSVDRERDSAPRTARGREREVLLDGKVGAASGERILEDTRDERGAARRPPGGDVLIVDDDTTTIDRRVTRQHVQDGRLAGAVRADDGDELAGGNRKVETAERRRFHRRAAAEGDSDVLEPDHFLPRAMIILRKGLRAPGRISASVTNTAVTSFRSEALRPSTEAFSASATAIR